MRVRDALLTGLIALFGGAGAYVLLRLSPRESGEAHSADGHAQDSGAKGGSRRGLHGGRLLADGDIEVELAIFERGVPPRFRLWACWRGQPQAPESLKAALSIQRLGLPAQAFRFQAQAEGYLEAQELVGEPHFFDLTLEVELQPPGQAAPQRARWSWSSYEGRVELTNEAIAEAGLKCERAGPATISRRLSVYGRLRLPADRRAEIRPRFAGVVKEARKALGERVERDETVAVVESNESLQSYELRSPIGGIVAGRHAVAGEFLAAGEALYAIEDPSLLWAELDIHRQDFARLRVGQRVELALRPHEPPVSSSLLYLAPVVDVDTQTAAARVELPNPDGSLRPGQHLEAKIQIEETPVPLAVRESALQPFRDWTVVFVREGKVFEVRPLTLGRRDGEFAEVLEGLDPGREVVVEGAFLLRAELGKSGATHDH